MDANSLQILADLKRDKSITQDDFEAAKKLYLAGLAVEVELIKAQTKETLH